MAKITLNLIKRDNVKAVLEAIARKQHITKQEIAVETGLSLVTVGKITNILGEAGVLVHGKNVNQKIGRRAEVCGRTGQSRCTIYPAQPIAFTSRR